MSTAIKVMRALRSAYDAWAWSERCGETKRVQSENWARVMDLQKQVKALVKTMSTEDRAEFNARIVADGDNGLLGVS